jgi:hypothetical protein
LKSIQLTATNFNGVPISTQSGFVNLQGQGSTIQLAATGTYSGGTSQDLTKKVTYNVVVDPNNSSDGNGGTLLPPCQSPTCPAGTSPNFTSGTLEYSSTGLLTAVDPAQCTWVNSSVAPSTTPSWSYVGDYMVTATFDGVTSQPFFVPIGSAVGVTSVSNTSGACGPTT